MGNSGRMSSQSSLDADCKIESSLRIADIRRSGGASNLRFLELATGHRGLCPMLRLRLPLQKNHVRIPRSHSR